MPHARNCKLSPVCRGLFGAALATLWLLGVRGSGVRADDAQPPVSAYAGCNELLAQIELLAQNLANATVDAATFAGAAEQMAREAHLVATLAQAVGLSDAEHAWKPRAPGVVAAAQQLAAATDVAAAQAALARLQAALAMPVAQAPPLTWQGVAPLADLMRQVEVLQGKLTRGVKGPRFARTAAAAIAPAATVAVVGQAATLNTDYASDEVQQAQWATWAAAMRDSAGALRGALVASDQPTAEAALARLEQSCRDCHQVFHPERSR